MFLVVVFFIKTQSKFENQAAKSGLVYGDSTLSDVITKDTDQDGVLDWEEGLWDMDPTKQDTNDDGIRDDVEVAKIKAARGLNKKTSLEGTDTPEENLTETDKFSRELFAAVAALNQAGEIDQETADRLTTSLSEKIKSSTPKKVFVIADIKISSDNSAAGMRKYIAAIAAIYKKHPVEHNVLDTLKEFINDGENIYAEALDKLEPVVKQTSIVISELVNMEVPSEIASLHLDLINALERLKENVANMQLYISDPVVAMGAMSQYEENNDILQSTLEKLGEKVSQKLGS